MVPFTENDSSNSDIQVEIPDNDQVSDYLEEILPPMGRVFT